MKSYFMELEYKSGYTKQYELMSEKGLDYVNRYARRYLTDKVKYVEIWSWVDDHLTKLNVID